MKIGKKIKYLREEMCISRDVLSKVLNISLDKITYWENNSLMPDDESLKKMAETFGVSERYFTEDIIKNPEIKMTISLKDLAFENNVKVLRYIYPRLWRIKYLKYIKNNVSFFAGLSFTLNKAFKYDDSMKSYYDNVYYNESLENNNYYLIYKFSKVFVTCFSEDKLIIKKYTELPFKKRLFMYKFKKIIFDGKEFYVFNSDTVDATDNNSIIIDSLSSFVIRIALKIGLILFGILLFILLIIIITRLIT